MFSSKLIPYRPHDYKYDPIFTVSGPADHYKAAMVAKMSSLKFQICPVFPNMFSDLPSHPRIQLVQRRTPPVQSYAEKLRNSRKRDAALTRPVDLRGADRAKFICAVINLPPKGFMPYAAQTPSFSIQRQDQQRSEQAATSSIILAANGQKNTKDAQVETVYRDSTAQTVPWQPDHKIVGDGDPEILKLDFLKWGSGLPVGMHEVRLIERARMKRAWENVIKPNINDEASLMKFRDYVEALERDEWVFREAEIQEIQELRLGLLEQMLGEIHEKAADRTERKLNNFMRIQLKRKQEQLEKVRKKAARELRKLNLAQNRLGCKYREENIIEEHTSKKSEIYGPLMRHGEHPKRWHHVVDERLKKYRAQFIGVEQFSTLPRWLDRATELRKFDKKESKRGPPQLCIRETKWTTPVLEQLHDELKNLKKGRRKPPCTLRIRNKETVEDSNTPEVEGIPQELEDQYQAMVFLQSVIKGRAVQMLVHEGRDNCKELIGELKNSVGLLKEQKELRAKEKNKVRSQQREEAIQSVMVSRLQSTLGKLQGQVVGSILDFLNKELRRLLEERKAHAICWANERERNIREAVEAGRRQKEIRRRKEHDEMFKQVVTVVHDSVDVYLQEIITEGIEFASKEEATNYVMKLASKLEGQIDEIDKAYSTEGVEPQDEMIADLVHHFVLPDIEKNIIRQKMLKKQKENLKLIHDTIYSNIETIPKSDTPSTSTDASGFPNSPAVDFNSSGNEIPITHPDALEIYLSMLAAQDDDQLETQRGPFEMPEILSTQQGFTNNLETIPEITESVATTADDANIEEIETDLNG
ncbi:cilia- and flagella-associated protein 91-like [Cylas formicarius]|uniref:cilia- and flagella-associated protein 91-like n=1 Tax=Cylas formicarius TaxID=197179 RepID=UPI0029584D97|nr:cilia- and flagella-associated protein 91-like [Cylas formicarius]